jgi:hypothetical protein
MFNFGFFTFERRFFLPNLYEVHEVYKVYELHKYLIIFYLSLKSKKNKIDNEKKKKKEIVVNEIK